MSRGNQSKFFYGWVVVAACFLMCFCWGFFYNYGVFFKELTSEFGWSEAMTSFAISISTITYVVGAIIWGWLVDKYKPKWIVLAAAIIYGAGLALCSQIHAIWQLYIFFGVMAGFALGIAWAPPGAIVQRWFVKKRGLSLGIAMAGLGVGTAVMSPIAARLITTYGWRVSFIFMGIIVFVILALSAFLLVRSPEDKGLKPYGVTEGSINKPSATTSTERVWTAKEALKTKTFWLAWLMWFFFSIPVLIVMTYIVPHAMGMGTSKIAAAVALTLIGGLSIAGRLIGGALADKIGFNRTVGIGLIICAIMAAFLIGVKSISMLYLFAVIYGLAYGIQGGTVAGVIGHLFGTKSLPMILGFIITAWAVAGVIAPPLAGHIYDITNSYSSAFIIAAVSFAISAALALIVKPPQRAPLPGLDKSE